MPKPTWTFLGGWKGFPSRSHLHGFLFGVLHGAEEVIAPEGQYSTLVRAVLTLALKVRRCVQVTLEDAQDGGAGLLQVDH
jgi:hypothetical protein